MAWLLDPLAVVIVLAVLGAVMIAGGVYVIAGPGWCLIASGVFAVCAAAILRRGLIHG